MRPKLVLCNFLNNIDELKDFAMTHGFSGIDWSFDLNNLPKTPTEESAWVKKMSFFHPLEIRFHCPFNQMDFGHKEYVKSKAAIDVFSSIIHLVSKAGFDHVTVHIGLGHNSTEPLSWEDTIVNLRQIVQLGTKQGVNVCLENLVWGWTSKPDLFEKLIRKTGAFVTCDIGHAHACESVCTQQYSVNDFIVPHAGSVLNAHIYHTELAGVGHVPPEQINDIRDRLDLLQDAGCMWWVIEIREPDGLLQTKELIDGYLADQGV